MFLDFFFLMIYEIDYSILCFFHNPAFPGASPDIPEGVCGRCGNWHVRSLAIILFVLGVRFLGQAVLNQGHVAALRCTGPPLHHVV